MYKKIKPKDFSIFFRKETGEGPAPQPPGENGTRSRNTLHGDAVYLV